jgi:putative DNA primase/helicase
LVFDPTETCPAEYINTFKPDWPKYFKVDGYTEKLPPQDAINFFDGCKNIIKLSLQLCNYDISVWTWLMCWLAYPLQNPGTKLDTAVIVASPENGTGKSMLFDVIMRRIYGKYSVMIGATQLASQYNPWAENALLAIGEEMTDPADPQGNAARLKLMITGFEQVVEAKFLNGRLVRNYMNMVLLSNLITVVSIDLTDRRYLCISPEHILTETEQSVLEKEINGDGIEWFYSFLMSIKTEYLRKQANSTTLNYDSISFHQHSKPVMTVAKQTMARLSMSNWELFFEMWKAGQPEPSHLGALLRLHVDRLAGA